MNTQAANSLLIQIQNIERQLSILKRQVERLVTEEKAPTHSFADLKGILKGKLSCSEEDIDAVLYRLTPEFVEEIATLPETKNL